MFTISGIDPTSGLFINACGELSFDAARRDGIFSATKTPIITLAKKEYHPGDVVEILISEGEPDYGYFANIVYNITHLVNTGSGVTDSSGMARILISLSPEPILAPKECAVVLQGQSKIVNFLLTPSLAVQDPLETTYTFSRTKIYHGESVMLSIFFENTSETQEAKIRPTPPTLPQNLSGKIELPEEIILRPLESRRFHFRLSGVNKSFSPVFGTLSTNCDIWVLPEVSAPSFSIKHAIFSPAVATIGDTVTLTFHVTNTGTTPFTKININDAFMNVPAALANSASSLIENLSLGETARMTLQYVILPTATIGENLQIVFRAGAIEAHTQDNILSNATPFGTALRIVAHV